MPRHRIPSRFTLSALAGAVLLTACGSGSDPVAARPSSLRDVLGGPDISDEAQLKAQEAVRDCMAEQGFTYIPFEPPTPEFVAPGHRPSKEFRAKHAYGISTFAEGGPAEDDDDPNKVIRDALPPAQRTAYNKALTGSGDGMGAISVPVGGGPAIGLAPHPQDGGCLMKAFAAQGAVRDLGGVGEKLQDLERRIEADSRMVKANTAWAACMAEAGYSYTAPRDAVEDFSKRLAAIAMPGKTGLAPTYDDAALATLQADERATAQADDACYDEHLTKVEKAVRGELEKEFLADNPDLTTETQK